MRSAADINFIYTEWHVYHLAGTSTSVSRISFSCAVVQSRKDEIIPDATPYGNGDGHSSHPFSFSHSTR
jgi:hypothetical protein